MLSFCLTSVTARLSLHTSCFSVVVLYSGISRTVCLDRSPRCSGRIASCQFTARITPICCLTCVALSAASCPSAAPAMKNSPTRMVSGTCRMRWGEGLRGQERLFFLGGMGNPLLGLSGGPQTVEVLFSPFSSVFHKCLMARAHQREGSQQGTDVPVLL